MLNPEAPYFFLQWWVLMAHRLSKKDLLQQKRERVATALRRLRKRTAMLSGKEILEMVRQGRTKRMT